MNRPFAYLGFSCLLGLLVAFVLNKTAIITLMVIFALVFLVFAIKKMNLASTMLSIGGFVIGLVLCFIGNLFIVTPYENYIDQTAEIKGIIKELSKTEYGKTYYLVEVLEVNDATLDNSFNIELSSIFPLIFADFDYIYAQVEFDTVLSSYQKNFSRLSAYSESVSLEASLVYYSEEITANYSQGFEKTLYAFKNLLEQKIGLIFSDDNKDIVSAMLLGNKDEISDDIYKNFTLAGVNHILVVSGMHLAIIVGIFLYMFSKFKINKKVVCLIIVPIILLYTFLTGMSQSTVRSAIMMIILILSNILGEDTDNLNSLGFAVLLICLINPFSAADLGFILSVSATAGIIICSSKIKNKLYKDDKNKILEYIVVAFSVAVSAFLFVMPVLLYIYGTINIFSIFSCTLLAFPSAIILVLSFICLFLSFIPILNALVIPLSIIVDLFINLVLFVTEKIAVVAAKIPVLPDIRSVILFVGIILIVGILFLYKPTFRLKIITVITVVSMILSSCFITMYQFENTAKLMVLDAGAGIFSFIIKGDQAVVLIASGYQEYAVENVLQDYGVKSIQILSGENEENEIITALKEDYEVTIFDGDTIFDDIFVRTFSNNELIVLENDGKTIIVNSVNFSSTSLECDIAISYGSAKISADVILTQVQNDNDYPNSGTYINTDDSLFCITFNNNFDIRRLY